MDDTTAWLVALAILCATGVAAYVVAASNHRARLSAQQEGYRDATLQHVALAMKDMAEWNGRMQRDTIDKLLHALTEPINPPTPPTSVHEQELAGQAADAIREFHDGFSGDVTDTPDWTDGWLPDVRGDEPRIASVRPGDSVVPGQGNWDAMMGEGRAVVADEMVSGEDQWEGDRYDG